MLTLSARKAWLVSPGVSVFTFSRELTVCLSFSLPLVHPFCIPHILGIMRLPTPSLPEQNKHVHRDVWRTPGGFSHVSPLQSRRTQLRNAALSRAYLGTGGDAEAKVSSFSMRTSVTLLVGEVLFLFRSRIFISWPKLNESDISYIVSLFR